MDCGDCASQLFVYIDEEMSYLQRVRVSRHLRRCPPCEDAFTFEVELRRSIRRACCEDAPPELNERIQRALDD